MQSRYKQGDAIGAEKPTKMQRAETELKEKRDEIERLKAELKEAEEERKRIGEWLRRLNPGGLEPQVPSRKIKQPAPQIDDMPSLGPLAVMTCQTPIAIA